MSLFHHLHCALAHGRVAMFEEQSTEDIIFIMENGVDRGAGFQVKARMVLRESTLLTWIDIITKGPQEPEKTYYKEVYEALLHDKRLRTKDLMCLFKESEYAINKAISFLKQWNVISYQNHGKNSWWEVNTANACLCFGKLDS